VLKQACVKVRFQILLPRVVSTLGIADVNNLRTFQNFKSKWFSNLLLAEVVILDSILSRYIAHYYLLHILSV
jgi:hypothetical protein